MKKKLFSLAGLLVMVSLAFAAITVTVNVTGLEDNNQEAKVKAKAEAFLNDATYWSVMETLRKVQLGEEASCLSWEHYCDVHATYNEWNSNNISTEVKKVVAAYMMSLSEANKKLVINDIEGTWGSEPTDKYATKDDYDIANEQNQADEVSGLLEAYTHIIDAKLNKYLVDTYTKYNAFDYALTTATNGSGSSKTVEPNHQEQKEVVVLLDGGTIAVKTASDITYGINEAGTYKGLNTINGWLNNYKVEGVSEVTFPVARCVKRMEDALAASYSETFGIETKFVPEPDTNGEREDLGDDDLTKAATVYAYYVEKVATARQTAYAGDVLNYIKEQHETAKQSVWITELKSSVENFTTPVNSEGLYTLTNNNDGYSVSNTVYNQLEIIYNKWALLKEDKKENSSIYAGIKDKCEDLVEAYLAMKEAKELVEGDEAARYRYIVKNSIAVDATDYEYLSTLYQNVEKRDRTVRAYVYQVFNKFTTTNGYLNTAEDAFVDGYKKYYSNEEAKKFKEAANNVLNNNDKKNNFNELAKLVIRYQGYATSDGSSIDTDGNVYATYHSYKDVDIYNDPIVVYAGRLEGSALRSTACKDLGKAIQNLLINSTELNKINTNFKAAYIAAKAYEVADCFVEDYTSLYLKKIDQYMTAADKGFFQEATNTWNNLIGTYGYSNLKWINIAQQEVLPLNKDITVKACPFASSYTTIADKTEDILSGVNGLAAKAKEILLTSTENSKAVKHEADGTTVPIKYGIYGEMMAMTDAANWLKDYEYIISIGKKPEIVVEETVASAKDYFNEECNNAMAKYRGFADKNYGNPKRYVDPDDYTDFYTVWLKAVGCTVPRITKLEFVKGDGVVMEQYLKNDKNSNSTVVSYNSKDVLQTTEWKGIISRYETLKDEAGLLGDNMYVVFECDGTFNGLEGLPENFVWKDGSTYRANEMTFYAGSPSCNCIQRDYNHSSVKIDIKVNYLHMIHNVSKDKFNSFVVPFDIKGDNLKDLVENGKTNVYYFSGVAETGETPDGKVKVAFGYRPKKATETVTAYMPYLIKGQTGNITFKDVVLAQSPATVTYKNNNNVWTKTVAWNNKSVTFKAAADREFTWTATVQDGTLKAYERSFFDGELKYYDVDTKYWYAGSVKLNISEDNGSGYVIGFVGEDGEEEILTGIESVEVENNTTVNGIYNLNGQKVQSMKKPGLYIVNGKKIMVK